MKGPRPAAAGGSAAVVLRRVEEFRASGCNFPEPRESGPGGNLHDAFVEFVAGANRLACHGATLAEIRQLLLAKNFNHQIPDDRHITRTRSAKVGSGGRAPSIGILLPLSQKGGEGWGERSIFSLVPLAVPLPAFAGRGR